MNWWHLGRQQTSEEAFKGCVGVERFDNPAAIDRLFYNYDLWYFKFATTRVKKEFKTKECVSYFGVYDLDFKDPERQPLIRAATVAGDKDALLEILQPELALVHELFAGIPYAVFASGSKGMHVYTLDSKMLVKLSAGKGFTSDFCLHFLLSKLPANYVALLDKSIYNMGSGIRPFTRAHPTTKVLPFILYQSENFPGVFGIFDFFVQSVSDAPFPPALEITAQEVNLPPPVPVIREVTTISVEETCDLFAFVQKKSLKIPSVAREVKGTLYLTGNWCPIKDGFHDERSLCTFWHRSGNGVWVCRCFAAGCRSKKFLLRQKADPVTMPKDERINANDIIEIESPDKYLPQQQVIELFKQHNRIVLCSGLGSGKTTVFESYLKQLDAEALQAKQPRKPVIIIGTRRSQCKCWFNKFAHLGFTDYDDESGSLANHDRLIICLNSIARLTTKNELVVKPGTILLIDEIVSFCRWLGGPLLGKSVTSSQPFVFEIVKVLLATCEQVICMDGLPDSLVSFFLDLIGQLPRYKWIVNKSLTDSKLWKIFFIPRLFHDDLVASVRKGTKVALVCNIKAHIFTYQEYFIKNFGVDASKILAITGSMPEELRNSAGDPNRCWTNYQIVLYNNSLGPGASFDLPDEFEVFCLAKVDAGFDPILALQLYNRIRSPIGNVVRVLVLHKEQKEGRLTSSSEILTTLCTTVSDYTRYATPIVEQFLDYSYGSRDQEEDETSDKDSNLGQLDHLMGVNRESDRPVVAAPSIIRTQPAFDRDTNSMVQAVVPQRQTFVFRFEPNPLLKLMAELQSQSNNTTLSSAQFTRDLRDLITRSGGLIKWIGNPPQTKQDKARHHCYMKNLLVDKEFKPVHAISQSYLFTPMSQLSEKQNNKIKESLQLDNDNMQQFRQLYKVLIREGGEDLEPAAKYVALDATRCFVVPPLVGPVSTVNSSTTVINQPAIARSTLNHTATTGELLPLVRTLFETINMKIEENKFTGFFETKTLLHGNSKPLEDILIKILKLRKRKEPGLKMRKIIPQITGGKHHLLVDHLLDVCQWLGFELCKKTQHRIRRGNDAAKRTTVYDLEPDETAFRVKLASLGIDKLGQKRTRDEAYLSVFNE